MKKIYAAQQAWRKRNRKKVVEIQRRWRKANPNKIKKYEKTRYLKHRNEELARNKKYQKKRRKEKPELVRKLSREYYRKNSNRFVSGRTSSEMRSVIFVLTGHKPKKGTSVKKLYDVMTSVIRKNRQKALKEFPFGKPDAIKSRVEWKFGFDRLRGCQFVWNILNGNTCKVRWAVSCDEFEKAILGKKNGSKLFKSYRDFVIWGYGI